MYIESRLHSREVFKFLEVLEYHEAICFAYMEATVVGGSVAEGITQRWYSSLTEDYIYN